MEDDGIRMVTAIFSAITCVVILYYFFVLKSHYRWFFVPVFPLSLWNIIDFVMVEYLHAPLNPTTLLMQDIYHGAIIIYYAALLYKLHKTDKKEI